MGRVRDLGSLDDCVEISRRTSWVRPVVDFAHMHATSDGAFVEPEPFRDGARARGRRARARTRRSTSTSRTSRSPTATRRSTCPTARARSAPTRSATALDRLRAAGDGDLRVARRGVEPGDPRRAQMIRAAPSGSSSSASRSSSAARLLVAAAVAQEPRVRRERLGLGVAVVGGGERVDRVPQQELGLVVAPLRRAHEAEHHAHVRPRHRVLHPHGLDGGERPALGLLDVALRQDELGERPLRLDHLRALLQREERADRLADDLLGAVGVPALPDGQALELLRPPRVGRRADLVEQLARRTELALRVVEAAPAQVDRAPDAGDPRGGRQAAARHRQPGRGLERGVGARELQTREMRRGDLAQRKALEVGAAGLPRDLERFRRVPLDALEVSLPPADARQQRQRLGARVAGRVGQSSSSASSASVRARSTSAFRLRSISASWVRARPSIVRSPAACARERTSSISTDAAGSSHSRHAALAA